jgi:hypothetical protein
MLHHRRLGFLLATLLLVSLTTPADGQGGFGNFIQNLFRPIMRPLNNLLRPINFGLRDIFRFGPQTNAAFRAEGRDKLFPDDCGRLDDGKGKLCFGDPALCKERTNLAGVEQFGGHNYYFSWLDQDSKVRNTKWDWFNARNYCRKRCMDLVSFESQQEYDWVKGFIDGGVKFFWTSGRKCNFDGCDKPEFFPKLVNGWFWSANQVKMPPTNGNQFHDWSHTGGNGVAQPDDREHRQGGEEEACMAVLNNFYGDGIKWHDVACHHEKPIICEDEPGHLRFVLGK